MKFRVIEDWQASYADPIRLNSGDLVHLTGREDNWDGHIWLWARAPSGLEGWIPGDLVKQGNRGTVSREDYSAMELTCRTGETVYGGKERHGWVHCRDDHGNAGWVPRKNLSLDVS